MSDSIEKWKKLKDQIRVGDEILGTIIKVMPYGVFVDIGFEVESGYKFCGIIDIVLISNPGIKALPVSSENWPKINDKIECVVLAYRERSCEVDLGIKT
jgi:ribosomal protein S1